MTDFRKKLIEVALPLEAINRESAHEKSVPRKGHPATMHVWWARRPLAACRAVLFASLVNDPSGYPDQFPTEEEQESERQRLFRIIEELVKWENSSNETVLAAARAEIMRSTDGKPPPVLDPFCGGGSIPLEAHRLGLEVRGSDLNPIPVLITKALIEIPPRFAGLPPVNPEAQAKLGNTGWRGAQGLADDVRHYGRWMRNQAESSIGHLYPKVVLPAEHGGGEVTVVAWLWARSVKCPNPACGAEMPLVRSFALSTKKDKKAWVEPIVDVAAKTVRFQVRTGTGAAPEGTVNSRGARCLACGEAVPFEHVRQEATEGRMGAQLMAVVGEGVRRRHFLAPDARQETAAMSAVPEWQPESELPTRALGFRVQRYGIVRHSQLFAQRQLAGLATLSGLVDEVRHQVRRDAIAAGLADDDLPLARGGLGARAYSEAVATYVAFAVDKLADWNSSLCSWIHSIEGVRPSFPRSAMSMVWDFAETNPFSNSVGNIMNHIEWAAAAAEAAPANQAPTQVRQLDVSALTADPQPCLIVTDPPYYDNVGYAALSDFFYVWLKRSIGVQFPEIFSTLLTPKAQELIAEPARHEGGARAAKSFFEAALVRAFAAMRSVTDEDYPLCLFYAFKQEEVGETTTGARSIASTGWETMLSGLVGSGLAITGTWPMRTERSARPRQHMSNALASSVVLVCRPRPITAPLATRKEFIATLRAQLPDALKKLQHGSIAPVDLAQAAIGPGMAVFSQYSKVMETDGSQVSVRTALALINQALDEILAEQEGEFDSDTRWAIAWFEEFGMEAGEYGVAETLCTAKNCSVQGLAEAGILEAGAGKVRLLRRHELDEDWDPLTDKRLTVWEMTQHLLRRLDQGEAAAAALARQLGSYSEVARDLAYRLYLVCERKKWAQEALAYNGLVVAWPQIQQLAAAQPASAGPSQTSFEV